MTVDVIYQGLSLAKGATTRSEAGGLFVELEAPMPVGTQLELVTPDGTKSGRVDSVIEGPGAGMLIAFGARKNAEPNAPMAEMKSAPPVQVSESPVAEKAEAAAEKAEPEDGGSDDPKKKKERRTKPRKTVIGH